jgi:hypothetical protein
MTDCADHDLRRDESPELDDDAALSAAAKIIARKDDTIRSLCRDLEIAETRIRILELRQAAALRADFDPSADSTPAFLRRQAG